MPASLIRIESGDDTDESALGPSCGREITRQPYLHFDPRTPFLRYVYPTICPRRSSHATHRYCVVDRLSPVSTSVANTLKRSLLIFLTIIYFGNEMTVESAGGVVVVVCGVGLYNWARVRYPAPAADDEVPSAGDKDDT